MSDLSNKDFKQIKDVKQKQLQDQLHQQLSFTVRTTIFIIATICIFSLAIFLIIVAYITKQNTGAMPYLLLVDLAGLIFNIWFYSSFKKQLKYFNANAMPHFFRILRLLKHQQLKIIKSKNITLPNLKISKPPFYLSQYVLQNKKLGDRFTLTLR